MYGRKLCRRIIPEIRVGRKAQGQMGRGVVSAAADVAQQQTIRQQLLLLGALPFLWTAQLRHKLLVLLAFWQKNREKKFNLDSWSVF